MPADERYADVARLRAVGWPYRRITEYLHMLLGGVQRALRRPARLINRPIFRRHRAWTPTAQSSTSPVPSDDPQPSVEDGYRLLGERVRSSVARLAALAVSDGSAVADDDKFLRPIYRTYQEGAFQAIHSALDHLSLLADSLSSKPEPHRYAQLTLIRTAITAASTAVWLLCDDQTERRCRTLEFIFRDNRSHLAYIDTVVRQPRQLFPDDERAATDALVAALRDRQDWIITQANLVCSSSAPIEPRDFGRRTSDTRIVEMAGGALGPNALGDGWNPAVSILSTWRRLSGYAHATPWSSIRSRKVHSEPDPVTGQVTVSQTGDAEYLLDAAFRAVIVVENAISRYEALAG